MFARAAIRQSMGRGLSKYGPACRCAVDWPEDFWRLVQGGGLPAMTIPVS